MNEGANRKKGEVRIADEVIGVIACLAATEVTGVVAMNGGYTHDQIAVMPVGSTGKCAKVSIQNGVAAIRLSIIISVNATIPDVSKRVQERVKGAIEMMTGIKVSSVSVNIAGVDM